MHVRTIAWKEIERNFSVVSWNFIINNLNKKKQEKTRKNKNNAYELSYVCSFGWSWGGESKIKAINHEHRIKAKNKNAIKKKKNATTNEAVKYHQNEME